MTERKRLRLTFFTAKDMRLKEHRIGSCMNVVSLGIAGRLDSAQRWIVARGDGRGDDESNRVLLDGLQFGDIAKGDPTLLTGWQSADIDLNS